MSKELTLSLSLTLTLTLTPKSCISSLFFFLRQHVLFIRLRNVLNAMSLVSALLSSISMDAFRELPLAARQNTSVAASVPVMFNATTVPVTLVSHKAHHSRSYLFNFVLLLYCCTKYIASDGHSVLWHCFSCCTEYTASDRRLIPWSLLHFLS